MRTRIVSRAAMIAVLVFSSTACRGVFTREVKTLSVDLSARASLNPDELGRAYPVSVRIYQLRDRSAFDAASYDALIEDDKALLAQAMEAQHGVVLEPGASASVSLPMQSATRHVAIVAFFRGTDPQDAWRLVVPREELRRDKPLALTLVGSELKRGDAPP